MKWRREERLGREELNTDIERSSPNIVIRENLAESSNSYSSKYYAMPTTVKDR
jgi:hypothetical protein